MIQGNLITVAALILAAMFILAGIKAVTGTRAHGKILAGFGVPASASQPVARLLAVCELVVGAALLVPDLRHGGAIAGLGLLSLYTAVLGATLLSGKRPRCNCFGELSARPISYKTLLRNAAFIALAALVAWPPAVPVAALTAELPAAAMFAGGVIAMQGWLMWHLMQQNGRLFLKIDTIDMQLRAAGFDEWNAAAGTTGQRGLPIGTLAPQFPVTSHDGRQRYTLDELRSKDRPTILVFSGAECGPCKEMQPQIAHWQHQYGSKLQFLIITAGAPSPSPLADITYHQQDREAATLYDAAATPSAVVITPEGAIGSTLAVGSGQIGKLVRAIAAASEMDPAAFVSVRRTLT